MINVRDLGWRYWALIDALLFTGLAGWPVTLRLALAVAVIQIGHYRLREGRFTAFPVQVRGAYAGLLAIGLWVPAEGLLWFVAVGTLAQVLVGYCFLARVLSLAPWNRSEPLSWRGTVRTFLAKPTAGNILQGQPAIKPMVQAKTPGDPPTSRGC